MARNAQLHISRTWRGLFAGLSVVGCIVGAVSDARAATRPAPKHVVKPYTCKQWGYSFVVPAGWASKSVRKQQDRCSNGSGASPDFYSKDKRAYLSIRTTTSAPAITMTMRILLAAGSSPDDIRAADRPINGAMFHIGTAGVNFRGDGTNYFFFTACAEHRGRAYCFSGSIARDANYQFAAQVRAMETALDSFRFLP